MSVLGSFRLWLVALVAVIALALIATPHAPTTLSRVTHLESLVRCPACADLSVAQSNATSALAVRREIVRAVRRGESDSRILTSLESTYGSQILLSPPTTGLGALLWITPVAALGVLAFVGLRLARRR